ncbi:hypothetical protein MCOR27_006231 [Pyricularia oryzae]|nr:hypothetical protein MCOR01_000584 [Pyricularia oryzae]KAI6276941.1 hypothetical protein MCOR27_006231 [Pyricularia oryzae]KAI6324672.1 hypothetical protein MCOR30_007042 [Pyricularia oryzae]KAI6324828.1 hypothetical protein MCOR34_001284 [Pyricularia oryzae]KAI6473726.1 hypothetical protein MCOR17_002498 [Pyricularia oryzae]
MAGWPTQRNMWQTGDSAEKAADEENDEENDEVLCRPPRVSTATEAGSWQYSEDALAKTVECSRLVTPGRRLLVLLDEAGRAFTGYKDDCTAPQGLESYHVVRWLHDWRMNREGKLDEDELIWALTGKQTRFSGTLVQMISNMKLAQDKLLRQYALAEKLYGSLGAIRAVASSVEIRSNIQDHLVSGQSVWDTVLTQIELDRWSEDVAAKKETWAAMKAKRKAAE